jgi:hypothetical protein
MQLKNADIILIQFPAEKCLRARQHAPGASDALAEASDDVSAKETMKHSQKYKTTGQTNQEPKQSLIQQQIQYRQSPRTLATINLRQQGTRTTKWNKPWPNPKNTQTQRTR